MTEQETRLAANKCPDLKSLLATEPGELGSCLKDVPDIGEKRASQLRAILVANRTQVPVLPPTQCIPPAKEFEFYVDFEFFTSLNVDCEQEWPALEGREMIFMIGVGWQDKSAWTSAPKIFRAKEESKAAEAELLQEFLDYLATRTGGAYGDPARTALYHWSAAEKTQSEDAADRHGFAANHPLRKLPWQDLRKVFMDGPAAVPGAWSFGLKEVVKALGHLDEKYDPHWVGDLNNGLSAMLLGLQVYSETRKLATAGKLKEPERKALQTYVHEGWEVLESYLRADCRALYELLRWLRTAQPAPGPAAYVGWDAILKTFPVAPRRAYAGLNDGKGVIVYGQPVIKKSTGKLPLNHLIWGDELAVLETRDDWCKIQVARHSRLGAPVHDPG